MRGYESMLWEIVLQAAQAFLVQAESVPIDLPVEEQMKRLVYGHLTIMAYEQHAATVFFNEWRYLSPDRQERIKQLRDIYEACFQRVIEEGAMSSLCADSGLINAHAPLSYKARPAGLEPATVNLEG